VLLDRADRHPLVGIWWCSHHAVRWAMKPP
jgi:hypothetical protein